MKWHPAAEAFPMMTGEELDDLAADIAERGLLHPIVLTADENGEVIGLDGRNRWEACKRAKVKPTTTVYDGDDPVGFVLAVNCARRQMTKGQVAMATVAVNSFATNDFGEKQRLAEANGTSRARISYASTVAAYAPDLVAAVIAGGTPLDAAYKVAQERKKAASSDEAKLAWLRENHPNFAEMVAEEQMSLAEAMAAAKERDESVASARKLFLANLAGGVRGIQLALEGRDVDETVRFHMTDEPDASPESFRAAADLLLEAADALEALRKES